MSIGDAIQRLIDPVDPRVTIWLRRELPRLVDDGVITTEQATAIGRRYGLPDALSLEQRDAETAESSGARTVLSASAPLANAPATEAPDVDHTRAAGSPFFAEHAITIVLYLGAFLVVSAVAAFLALNWGEIGGAAKLASLLLVDAGFFVAALLCLPRASVRPAGRTFLAIGALLLPADVAAAYAFLFADGPLPPAAFWLFGAALAGGLYSLLSVRIASRAYGALAALALPVAGGSIASLAHLDDPAIPLLAALAVGAGMVAAGYRLTVPLGLAVRVVGSLLLVPIALTALLVTFDAAKGDVAGPLTLVVAFAALALEATRSDRLRGPTGALALALGPCIALAVAFGPDRYPLVGAAVVCALIAAAIGARLSRPGRAVWDGAALVLAGLLPLAAWDCDGVSLSLALVAALVASFVAWSRRSILPLYIATPMATLAYVKFLDLVGSPDSPAWRLGVALWPLGLAWVALGVVRPKPFGGPSWLAAFLTIVAAVALTDSQTGWQAAIAGSAALATLVVAWRSAVAPVLLLSVPWLLLADYRLTGLAGLPEAYRLMALSVGGWLLVVMSLATHRQPANNRTVGATTPAGAAFTEMTDPRMTDPLAAEARIDTPAQSDSRAGAEPLSRSEPQAEVPATATSAPRLASILTWDWATSAWTGAIALAVLGPLLLLAPVGERERWLEAAALGWLNLAAVLAAIATAARSRDAALAASLALVPALLAGIGRLHPDDAQTYAVPSGLYLLLTGWLARRDRRPSRTLAASIIAGLGALALVGMSLLQSLDTNRPVYAVLALVEGLALVGSGIALRWRVLVVAGVAGTVGVVLRQLVDVVLQLPGWAILGGAGLLLLALAVGLLLARARLSAAGRAVADRWSGWD